VWVVEPVAAARTAEPAPSAIVGVPDVPAPMIGAPLVSVAATASEIDASQPSA
jgi:hypothetical protein